MKEPDLTRDRLNEMSYHTTHFARKFGRDLELITRPKLKQDWARVLSLPLNLSLTIAGFPLHTIFTAMSAMLPTEVYRLIQTGEPTTDGNQLTILSFNAVLREGFIAPFTAGVVPPSEAVEGFASRTEAIAHFVGSQGPDIFAGQEFNDPHAVQVFIEILKSYGYCSFLYDPLLNPLTIGSGLLIASKRKLANLSLICFPIGDRAGIAKFARRGTLCCSVLDGMGKPMLRIFNAHLDAGTDQRVRNRQLKHVLPHFTDQTIPTILVGDLNFDTSKHGKDAGLDGYKNIFEGQITYNDEGKLTLRGIAPPPNIEYIDVMIANTPALIFSDLSVKQVKAGKDILSDHFAIRATVTTNQMIVDESNSLHVSVDDRRADESHASLL
jgi:endonuclease/exonuclease/phosphatase family metal-dependent hydrolase